VFIHWDRLGIELRVEVRADLLQKVNRANPMMILHPTKWIFNGEYDVLSS
jgi:hypothetical protein